jgi:phosphatidylinositol alpha-1,6-mannosyltransferase
MQDSSTAPAPGSAPLRVLMLSWNYAPRIGGIEQVAQHVYEGLSRRGHAVTLVTSASDQPEPDPRVLRAKKFSVVSYLLHALRLGISLTARERFELIFCPSVVSLPVGWLVGWLRRIPVAVMLHGSDAIKSGWLYKTVVTFLVRRAKGVVVNSGPTRTLVEGLGVPSDRIAVIQPGVQASAFAFPPPRVATGKRTLITTGRLIKRKGVLEFVRDCLPELVRRFPDIEYRVVGADASDSIVHTEPMSGRIRQAAVEAGMADRVVLVGAVSDAGMREELSRADLFVFPVIPVPGDVEGFGIVLLEAALCGVPSVATRVGGIPDAVEPEVSGLLVPSQDPAAMIAAISRLLENPGLHRRLQDQGLRRARQVFDWPRKMDQFEVFFHRLAGRDVKTRPS